MKLLPILTFSCLFLAQAAHAATPEETFLTHFARCDGSEFGVIKQYSKPLSQYAEIETRGKVAAFKLTPQPENEFPMLQSAAVTFKKPFIINGIEFTSYYTKQMSLPFSEDDVMDFYYWGLTLSEEQAKQLPQKLPQLNLRHVGEIHSAANEQIIADTRKSLQFQPNHYATTGTPPAKHSVEKLLMLSKEDNQYSLSCTMQGSIPNKVLHTIRPDLKD